MRECTHEDVGRILHVEHGVGFMMDTLNVWLWLGATLVLLEFLLPGLVVIFVGLGALTVALGMYLTWIDSLLMQLSIWFVSSLVYVSTLRVFLVRLYPSDTEKVCIDEIEDAVGHQAEVIEPILCGGEGRIQYNESTWQARVEHGQKDIIQAGAVVKIVGRDNITWLVEQV